MGNGQGKPIDFNGDGKSSFFGALPAQSIVFALVLYIRNSKGGGVLGHMERRLGGTRVVPFFSFPRVWCMAARACLRHFPAICVLPPVIASSSLLDGGAGRGKRDSERGVQCANFARPTVNLNHFRLLRVVGRGAFGKVRIVERKDTNLSFALKYIRKDEGWCNMETLGIAEMHIPV